MSTLDAMLGAATVVDLTQPLGPDTVPWPGSALFAVSVGLTHERVGAYTRRLGVDAAAYLVERGVVGIGIDTLSSDPGSSTD